MLCSSTKSTGWERARTTDSFAVTGAGGRPSRPAATASRVIVPAALSQRHRPVPVAVSTSSLRIAPLYVGLSNRDR